MVELVELSEDMQEEFLSFWDELELADENPGQWMNWGDPRTRADLADPVVFAQFVADVHRNSVVPDEELPADRVRATTLWLSDGGRLLGRVNLRHALTPYLFEAGGHIGYVVRPSERRKGHATEILRRALPHAADLEIGRVLITCDDDNLGSRKVIEANGGVLEDIREGKRRYWIET